MVINREDMLELTRRMTDARTHIGRLAGGYLDEEGYVDGTFNRYLGELSAAERRSLLAAAKAVPFGKTNEELRAVKMPPARPGNIRQALNALRLGELKNDALLLTFYEHVGSLRKTGRPFAVCFFYGSYDVPVKARDKEWLEGSEEVYRYLIGALCPYDADYRIGAPVSGFLYPAFTDRSTDEEHILVYAAGDNAWERECLCRILGI